MLVLLLPASAGPCFHFGMLPRTLPLFVATNAAAGSISDLSKQQLHKRRGQLHEFDYEGLIFELFLPWSWRPATTVSYPVLIFLHGRGESGGFGVTNAQSLPLQLLSNQSFATSFPFISIVPQCPAECAMENHWLAATLQAVTGLVHNWVVPVVGGDPARVYLSGQSMGGHGAWTYAAQQPRLFAGLIVVCGCE